MLKFKINLTTCLIILMFKLHASRIFFARGIPFFLNSLKIEYGEGGLAIYSSNLLLAFTGHLLHVRHWSGCLGSKDESYIHAPGLQWTYIAKRKTE